MTKYTNSDLYWIANISDNDDVQMCHGHQHSNHKYDSPHDSHARGTGVDHVGQGTDARCRGIVRYYCLNTSIQML